MEPVTQRKLTAFFSKKCLNHTVVFFVAKSVQIKVKNNLKKQLFDKEFLFYANNLNSFLFKFSQVEIRAERVLTALEFAVLVSSPLQSNHVSALFRTLLYF